MRRSVDPGELRREIAYDAGGLVETFGHEHLRCIHDRRQQADEIADRAGRRPLALDGTGQGMLGPRTLGIGLAPECEQAQEVRRHGDREDSQERCQGRPAPAPATGVFHHRDGSRRIGNPSSQLWRSSASARPRRIAVAGPSEGNTGRSFPGRGAGRGPASSAGRARACAPGRASRSPMRPGTEGARSRGCTASPRGRRRRIADR